MVLQWIIPQRILGDVSGLPGTTGNDNAAQHNSERGNALRFHVAPQRL
jgi:hypothetical protein